MDKSPQAGIRALECLSFFMADVQAGIGPFLGVFLLAQGWKTGAIGAVMTLGGVVGMFATTPAGALVDSTSHKRALVVVSSICTVLASALLLVSAAVPLVAFSQIATALAAAVLGPALAGITLGMVRRAAFDRQFGRNQAINHAGNMVGAALSGLLGWKFGFAAVFALAALFAVFAIISVWLIPARAIDDRAARGWEASDAHADRVSGLRVLLTCKPLLMLGFALLLFHLGNAAMLPLYGMAVVTAHQGNPALFTALTVVVAQTVMVAMSLLAVRWMRRYGHWWVILFAFIALPIRGVMAACFIDSWGVWPVQALDGIGAGLQSVAVPAMVAALLHGTGRVNVGQGAVMSMQGIGAALSPLLGGAVAQAFGYRTTFLLLGAIAIGSLVLWCQSRATLRSHEATGSTR
ncbi:MFS transporter [Dyella acidiphila]|uniref:MFS transporter n=1 Tax=Dyella acidiphila TaxID=2775866 RepID=A0ABR9G9T0_9GAMM|nr:MFS transporter [Dyella acidiphila]MBE1160786.1 MFS transporter [Dyella acidiphila]